MRNVRRRAARAGFAGRERSSGRRASNAGAGVSVTKRVSAKGDDNLRRAGQRLRAALHAAAGGAGAAVVVTHRRRRAIGRDRRGAQAAGEGAAVRHRQRQQQGLQRDHIGRDQRDQSPGSNGFAHRCKSRRVKPRRPPVGATLKPRPDSGGSIGSAGSGWRQIRPSRSGGSRARGCASRSGTATAAGR